MWTKRIGYPFIYVLFCLSTFPPSSILTPTGRDVMFYVSLSKDFDSVNLSPGDNVFVGQDLFLTLCYEEGVPPIGNLQCFSVSNIWLCTLLHTPNLQFYYLPLFTFRLVRYTSLYCFYTVYAQSRVEYRTSRNQVPAVLSPVFVLQNRVPRLTT